MLEIFILSLLGLAVVSVGVRWLVRWKNTRKTALYLQKFKLDPDLGIFYESRPLISHTQKLKLERAVLLLHGWSASPDEFIELTKELENLQFPYYAPLLTGFGLNSFGLLRKISPADWLRDAIVAYDLLSSVTNKVSVVGHSNGSVLAVYLAQCRSVDHLILSGPNLMISEKDKVYKKLLTTPVVSHLVRFLIPIVRKPVRFGRVTSVDTLDPKGAFKTFHYPALPIRSLKVLWELQDKINILKAKYTDLTLLYGEKDSSIDIPSLLQHLEENHIPFEKYSFAHSAHNILEDFDKKEAAQRIAAILSR